MGNLPTFYDATRVQSKASIMIEGLQGSGKSGLALLIARALADDWSHVFGVDTENRSLNLFEGLTLSTGEKCDAFKKVDLMPENGYMPSNFITLRNIAIEAGAQAFMQDSISHAWVGKNGILETVNELEAKNSKLNKFNAWGQPEVMTEKDLLTQMIRDERVHVITTVRLKEKFTVVQGEKTSIESIGEQQIMQGDMKYEPDLLLRMVSPGTPDGEAPKAKVMKSRYAILRKDITYSFTAELLAQLKEYLDQGADPVILVEQQKNDMVVSLNDLLKNDSSKATMFRMIKKQMNIDPEAKLKDLSLDQLQAIYARLSI